MGVDAHKVADVSACIRKQHLVHEGDIGGGTVDIRQDCIYQVSSSDGSDPDPWASGIRKPWLSHSF